MRGVLNTPPDLSWTLTRVRPEASVAASISWVWIVTWESQDIPHQQVTLPYPTANLVLEDGSLLLYGPVSKRFEKTIDSKGCAVGLKFRPGGVKSLLKGSVSAIVDKAIPASEVFTNHKMLTSLLESDTLEPGDAALQLQSLVAYDLSTDLNANLDLVSEAMRLIVETRLTKVGQLADLLAMSRRSLQRLFHDYVGLGVKATIRRYRLQEAAEHAVSGTSVDWSSLANDLGYYDQSHLIGEFKSTFGVPPEGLKPRALDMPIEC